MRDGAAIPLSSGDARSSDRAWAVAGLALVGIGGAAASPAWHHAWVLLFLAPLLEETVFRAGVQEWLMRAMQRPIAANLLTATLFALSHVAAKGDWAQMAVAAPALLIGWVYARQRKLRHCVILHGAMNALWLVAAAYR